MKRASVLVAASLLGTGCIMGPRAYVQPLPEQPHAVLKVRVIHHATPGPSRSARLLINELTLPLPEQPDLNEAATGAVRVRPEAARFKLSTEFYHLNTRTETYNDTERYACGTTGTGSYQTTQYCTRTVSRTRTVTDHITDAQCTSSAALAPKAGGMYLLQYDFYGHEECALKCFVQTPKAGGDFELEPCPEPPPPPPKPAR